MRRIDELHLESLSRAPGCCAISRREGVAIGRRHVATLMKRMGIGRSIVGETRRNRRMATRFTPIFFAA